MPIWPGSPTSLLKSEEITVFISVIYITHDLTTAHQLCDDIMVLYAGNMVEAGPIDLIVRNPSHPYTKLLVNSIPFPDPDMNWKKYDPKDRLKLDVKSGGWRNK